MKKDYLQTLPKPTDIKNQAYNAYFGSVQKLFAEIQLRYDRKLCQNLLQQIKKTKDVRQLKKIHKKPIYEFFLKRELQTLDYIKGEDSIDYKIMKLTRCKLDGFKLDWKSLWERILVQVPETINSNTKLVQSFIKHVKLFFDQNNALDVWNYFQDQNYKDLSQAVNLFTKISPQTKQSVLNDFVIVLVRSCQIKNLTNTQFIMLFLWVSRNRKQLSLPKEVFAFLNNVVLEFILAHGQSGSKKSVQSKFDSVSAELLEKSIGKANPGSIQLLQTIFSFIKKFVKPLQNSTKSVMFIYWLIKSIFIRVQKQKKTKEKLSKLIQKMQSKKTQQQNIEQQQERVQQKVTEEIEKQKNENKNLREQKEEEEMQEQQQEDQQDEQDQEEEQLQQLMLISGNSQLVFQKDDDTNEKGDTDEQKKQKMERVLANQITEDILNSLQKQIEEIFQVIYYVNSKKTISHLLRYIFRLFPKFIIRSFDVLDKASQIPNINQDGLVKNFTVTVQHMFMQVNYKEGVKNVLRVLQRAYQSRRIVDVWYIYECLGSKIPMLDQKDLELIPDADKQLFENTFELNHDRFYEQYSDHMLEAFKRLLRQGQFLQKNQYKSYGTTMQQTYFNSYPAMRKQFLQEVMQVIVQKPNSLAFSYFSFAQLPPRQYQILKTQFKSMNEQNKDTEQLRVQMLGMLSKNMGLQQLKPYIRKMAEKGHFKIIENYAIHRAVEQIKWQPLKTTLNYLYEDPKITIQFQVSIQERKKCLKQLMNYRDQLLKQGASQIQHIKPDQASTVSERIIKSYTSPAKVSTLAKRKKIYEILSIVGIINAMMQEKLIDIKNQKKLELIDSEVAPYEFLNQNKQFSKIVDKLLASQEVLHDPKLISILNAILTGGYFMYHDIEAYEQKKLTKQRKKNKNHEAPQCVNRIVYGNEYISLARNYMGLLLHKTHGGCTHSIKGKADELFILAMINANETYKDIRSMFQQAQMMPQFRKYLIDLMKHKVQNRQLIRRISSTIDFITKSQVSYVPFTDDEIIQFVSYHTTLMQSPDSKVKQNALKSFRKFSKIIVDYHVSDDLTQSMIKYSKIDKMEMVWIIYVAALIANPLFMAQKAQTEKRLLFLLQSIQKLILHTSRSIRRICLYLYAALIRKLKKLHAQYDVKNFQSVPYKQKSLQQFLQYGYIRPEFYDIDVKDKLLHKNHPIQIYQIKKPYQIPSHLFDLLIKNQNNANVFIKNFHSDLASTTQMMISAMQSSIATVDLFSIASKAIERLIYFFKTRDLSVSRSQLLVGGKFFKYLCIQDARQNYKFFNSVKQFVLSCLGNLQSLDNQTLVILYAYSLMNAYETTFQQRIPQVQKFLTKIFKQIIQKSSKLIYTKIQTLFFKKIKNKKAVQFIEEMCQEMISKNYKVFRAGYLLSTVRGKSFDNSKRILQKLFDQRLQLEHQSNILNTIYYILTYPQNHVWNLHEIQKTKVINLSKLKEEKKVKEILSSYIILSNKDIQNYLVSKLTEMLEDKQAEMTKTGFTILNNTIKSSSQLFMDEQNVQFISNLLNLWLKVLFEKKQLQLDFESGYKALDYLIGTRMLPPQIFERILLIIIQRLEPNKKSCDLLSHILSSPCNYIKISKSLFEKFTQKILTLESNSSLYKQLLQILSTFFRYRLQPYSEIDKMEVTNKNKRALLLQAYLLAENAVLKREVVKQVLKISSKDRKNIWAREMLVIRGQRQYFDDQQTVEVWREIKALSNPYHYHA